ncbi:hypothetical protein L227DRAFT_19633 [Lentinus tigrinus ALCF2SS1-6]|uniref:Uncharacterized protein n=1 Tax=Lentinus tigrinus ALCF2SS1-6 TaxID=1328759 RepID=A0A5C2SW89_9APHY|nr:hypothetical protein L227DRAFT_19633 [Lentinus tigrinus ALCF2SS1-6]
MALRRVLPRVTGRPGLAAWPVECLEARAWPEHQWHCSCQPCIEVQFTPKFLLDALPRSWFGVQSRSSVHLCPRIRLSLARIVLVNAFLLSHAQDPPFSCSRARNR